MISKLLLLVLQHIMLVLSECDENWRLERVSLASTKIQELLAWMTKIAASNNSVFCQPPPTYHFQSFLIDDSPAAIANV